MGHRPGASSDRSGRRSSVAPGPETSAGDARAVRRAEVTALVTGLVLGAVLAGGGVLLATQDSAEDRGDAVEQARIVELEGQEAENDAAAVVDLVSDAQQAYDDLTPALAGLARAVPPGNAAPDDPAATPNPARLRTWRGALADARQALEATDSAGTDANVARQGLVEGVELLAQSVTALAAGTPTPARAARDSAVRVWAIGATQLDELAIETDGSHVHLYLPLEGADVPMAPTHEE